MRPLQSCRKIPPQLNVRRMITSMSKLSRLIPLFLMVVCIVALPGIHAQTNVTSLEAFIKSHSLEQLQAKAENGDAKAQHALGFRYYKGDGMGKDLAAAAKWYRMAAEQGFAPAQCELGTLYARGEGVDKNDVEAARWFRKSAEQGELAHR